MNSEHSFEFQIVLSKPIGIWVWTLKQSCWSFYFEQVCLKDLVEILNGLREFLKKRKTALSYSNLPWLFSSPLSVPHHRRGNRHLLVLRRAGSRLASPSCSWRRRSVLLLLFRRRAGRHRLCVSSAPLPSFARRRKFAVDKAPPSNSSLHQLRLAPTPRLSPA